MPCKNATCKYNDDKTPNGCTLFPGASWLNCRGASVKPVVNNQTSIKSKNKETK